ncbi:MAG TPA: hypothetical protein VIJ20_13385 [Solirubrobacteraceae bacterium]
MLPRAIDLLASAWKDNVASIAVLRPARKRFVYGRRHVFAKRAETLSLTLKPSARGKLLLAHRSYLIVLRLWVTYTPSHGVSRSQGFYGLRIP